MAIFRWGHRWDPLQDLEREVDRLLSTVLTFQGVRFGRQYPPVNVIQLDSEYVLTAELPGIRPEELELTVANGVLTIKGERVGPEGIADERFRRQERPRGAWRRSISLPDSIEEEKMSAEFVNGVLKVHLPRTPVVRPRQIKV
ncbi:MAG: Hsp20/alpha crystallin family protein, partial [Planctomycetaceae bacterium]|nr:Hsp20/alpha crystallin family protein [Planctomycetaceae bacterium]